MKLIKNLFTITLAIFVVVGSISVFIQIFCILTGNFELSIFVRENIQSFVIATSGICGLLSFAYLMFSSKEKQLDEEEIEEKEYEENKK